MPFPTTINLTASYQRRLTYGFTIQASYTWAHALDEISNGGINPYSNRSVLSQFDPTNLRHNYGNADYDLRNSFNAQYVWNTPWKFSNKFANGAFGGWTLSQDFFVHSGIPVTVLDASTGNFVGNNNGNLIPAQVIGSGQGPCSNGLSVCFNSAAFTSAGSLSTFPNQMRNQYHGPGFFDSDFSINKNFKLTERFAFGIGANMYNVFNHPNFALPHDALGSGTFGTITAQAAPPTGPFGSFFAGLPSQTASSSSKASWCSSRSNLASPRRPFGAAFFSLGQGQQRSWLLTTASPLLVHFKPRLHLTTDNRQLTTGSDNWFLR